MTGEAGSLALQEQLFHRISTEIRVQDRVVKSRQSLHGGLLRFSDHAPAPR
jgi:hypothetical protein